MSILAASIIDGDGSVSVSRTYIPGSVGSSASHWNTLYRFLKDPSLGVENKAAGSMEVEGLICTYRKLLYGNYLALLCKRHANIADVADTATVLVDLINGLGPLDNRGVLFDALFALDETVQFGFADRPISLASVQERLGMHSAAEEAAIEERKAKEAEAEKIRRKKEAEFAAQRDIEAGIGTGALGLFNKAKGWLGLGEAKPEKKWGHGIPEAELERLRRKNPQGAGAVASKVAESSSEETSTDSSRDQNWTSAKPKVEHPKESASVTSVPLDKRSNSESSSDSSSEPPLPDRRPVGRGITLTKRK
ncbi:Coatomer delta subunit [Giardia duodenalis assemblage B]|uniref:Coatomer delta subunit n=1 Tax=Giardia duodenalis assemblage B TaxID=1394984 RepID=A0A132NT50_GIAIN|nr:Coatomer delta subunit [Giardia intestinalis assemblage B]